MALLCALALAASVPSAVVYLRDGVADDHSYVVALFYALCLRSLFVPVSHQPNRGAVSTFLVQGVMIGLAVALYAVGQTAAFAYRGAFAALIVLLALF